MTSFKSQPTSPGLMRLRGTLAEQKAALEISSGSVATDAIWDVAGDIVVGAGANTAARLAIGSALSVLCVTVGGTTVEYVGSSGTGNVARVDSPTFTGTVNTSAITSSGTVLVNGSAGVSGVAITNDVNGTNFKNQAANIVFLAYTFWGSATQSVVGVGVSTVRVTTGVDRSSVVCAGNTTTAQGFVSYRSDGVRVSSGQFDVVAPDITLSRLDSTTWQFGSGNANNALGNIALAAITASGSITGSNLSGTNTGDKTLSQLLPTMTGQSGKYLTNDGTVESWGTVVAINGTILAGLATGILKNTTTTGVPSIAVAGTDYVAPSGMYTSLRTTEISNVISANAATIAMASGNHQTLTLAAATAAVTVTLTPPASAAAGTLVLLQDDTARDITWASSATILWAGTQPTWASDAVSSYRVISWRYDGTRLFLAATNVFTANS